MTTPDREFMSKGEAIATFIAADTREDLALISEAQMVIQYCLEHGIRVAQEDLSAIMRFKDHVTKRQEAHYPDLKTAFLLAVQNLGQRIEPVQIANIKAIQKRYRYFHFKRFKIKIRLSASSRILTFYKVLGGTAFLIMMILHFVWLSGLDIQKDYLRIKEDIASINKQLQSLDYLNPVPAKKRDSLTFERESLQEQFNILHMEIKVWNTIRPATAHMNISERRAAIQPGDDLLQERLTKIRLSALEFYILPFLYSLLGTIVFILRRVSKEVREYSFKTSKTHVHLTRLFLGIIAGLAIGWFSETLSLEAGAIGNLSPLVLSFLAGYSIEIFFKVIDTLVGIVIPDTRFNKPDGSIQKR